MSDIIEVNDDSGNFIKIPIEPRKLEKFISSLLGQPQTLAKEINESFVADHSWLVHLISIIETRISQQNGANIVSFSVKIGYSGGEARIINSLEAFRCFSETKNIISTSALIKISTLIAFPQKDNPEKQEILLYFEAENSYQKYKKSTSPSGYVLINIDHTERTWADDLMRLISDEIDHILIAEGKIKKITRSIVLNPRSIFIPVFAMFFSMMYYEFNKNFARDLLYEKLKKILNENSNNMQAINEKIDFIINFLFVERVTNISSIMAIPFIVGVLIFYLGRFLSNPHPSFVVLSRAAEINKINIDKQIQRKSFYLFVSTVFSLLLGIFGNYLYDHLKTLLNISF